MIIYRRKTSRKHRRSKTHRRSKARRHNPVRRHKRSRTRARRHNPVRSHTRRRTHSRSRRRNPSLGKVVNKGFIVNALLVALGFAGGIKASSYIAKLPFMSSVGRFSGAVNLLLGMVIFMKAKNANVKAVAAGLGASGAYDLLAKNVAPLGLPSLQGVDVMGQHGIDVLPNAGDDMDDMMGVEANGVDVAGAQPVTFLGNGEEQDFDGEDEEAFAGNDYSGRF